MGGATNFNKIAGVIDSVEVERLKRLVFRVTKGKSFVFTHDFVDQAAAADQINRPVKSVYIIMYWDGGLIRDKILRICDSFNGNRYEVPEMGQINDEIYKITQSINDARNVYHQTKNSLTEQLMIFNKLDANDQQDDEISTIYIYKMFLAKEKAMYQTLNMMKMQNATFIGYFWAPAEQEHEVMSKIAIFPTVRMVRYDNHKITRPTYIKTNEFTSSFQLIVDTYGVPQYKEANPASLTIATFPFFFGVMFGDMGHGSILASFGLFMIIMWPVLKQHKIGKAIAEHRYLLTMMGFMATYAGMIYNDFFAIQVNFWGSCYNINYPY